jgi:hypothetical protein
MTDAAHGISQHMTHKYGCTVACVAHYEGSTPSQNRTITHHIGPDKCASKALTHIPLAGSVFWQHIALTRLLLPVPAAAAALLEPDAALLASSCHLLCVWWHLLPCQPAAAKAAGNNAISRPRKKQAAAQWCRRQMHRQLPKHVEAGSNNSLSNAGIAYDCHDM